MIQQVEFMPAAVEGDRMKLVLPWHLGRPTRVWTLFCTEKPELPFQPVHHVNAFLEDYVHDWNVQFSPSGAVFRYYSRVSDGNVWLLFEWE